MSEANGVTPYRIRKIVVKESAIPPEEPQLDKIPRQLPRPYVSDSFRMMLIGPSGSGKSNVFVNLLTDVYAGVFETFKLFCPTFYNDRTLNVLIQKSPTTGETFIEESDVSTADSTGDISAEVATILANCERLIKEHDDPKTAPPKCLLVFDDLTNEISQAHFMKNLFTKGRKYETSVIIMTNKYKVYNPQIRANTTHFVIFKPSTDQEIDDIAKDIAQGLDWRVIKDMMMKVFKYKDRPFLYVRMAAPLSERFMYKFEKFIPI